MTARRREAGAGAHELQAGLREVLADCGAMRTIPTSCRNIAARRCQLLARCRILRRGAERCARAAVIRKRGDGMLLRGDLRRKRGDVILIRGDRRLKRGDEILVPGAVKATNGDVRLTNGDVRRKEGVMRVIRGEIRRLRWVPWPTYEGALHLELLALLERLLLRRQSLRSRSHRCRAGPGLSLGASQRSQYEPNVRRAGEHEAPMEASRIYY